MNLPCAILSLINLRSGEIHPGSHAFHMEPFSSVSDDEPLFSTGVPAPCLGFFSASTRPVLSDHEPNIVRVAYLPHAAISAVDPKLASSSSARSRIRKDCGAKGVGRRASSRRGARRGFSFCFFFFALEGTSFLLMGQVRSGLGGRALTGQNAREDEVDDNDTAR